MSPESQGAVSCPKGIDTYSGRWRAFGILNIFPDTLWPRFWLGQSWSRPTPDLILELRNWFEFMCMSETFISGIKSGYTHTCLILSSFIGLFPDLAASCRGDLASGVGSALLVIDVLVKYLGKVLFLNSLVKLFHGWQVSWWSFGLNSGTSIFRSRILLGTRCLGKEEAVKGSWSKVVLQSTLHILCRSKRVSHRVALTLGGRVGMQTWKRFCGVVRRL